MECSSGLHLKENAEMNRKMKRNRKRKCSSTRVPKYYYGNMVTNNYMNLGYKTMVCYNR